jgi:hypothetical protein
MKNRLLMTNAFKMYLRSLLSKMRPSSCSNERLKLRELLLESRV